MAERRSIWIAMNGVTGRMGHNQHLVNSILALRNEGGLRLSDGRTVWPEPVLVGRSEDKLRAIAERHDLRRWSTSLSDVLNDEKVEIYFDAQATGERPSALKAAIEAGKHIYAEKPIAIDVEEAVSVAREVQRRGLRGGVVHDKLSLPGLAKMRRLVETGFFGRIVSIDIEFGYWISEGDHIPAQRPSWNYQAEAGGGLLRDMFPHWTYIIEGLVARIMSIFATTRTAIPSRVDEAGVPYEVTADDMAAAVLELEGGPLATVRSSWATRVYRDDLIKIQIDGTLGSAVAGTQSCKVQHRVTTGMPVWNAPDLGAEDFRADWQDVPDNCTFDNPFKIQWALFLSHVVSGTPFESDLYSAVRDVQLVELGMKSAELGAKCQVVPIGNLVCETE